MSSPNRNVPFGVCLSCIFLSRFLCSSVMITALAMAVFQTGDNVAPPNAPPVPPAPFAPAKAVAGAVKMACAKAEPAKIIETQRLFAELAMKMAEGQSS